jgi:tellurite resistance protein
MFKYEATNMHTEEAENIIQAALVPLMSEGKGWIPVSEDKNYFVYWHNVTGELMQIAKSHCDLSIYTKQRRLDAFEEMDARKDAEKNKPPKKWGQGYNDGKRR